MNLYTIGFTQKSAQQFFNLIKNNEIELLLDIRLNNSSQLAGFSKGGDLKYFLKELCNCEYIHALEFAPTEKILSDYKNKFIDWESYKKEYTALIINRNVLSEFFELFDHYKTICLLCSEPSYKNCHRGLLVNLVVEQIPSILVEHLA